ncbi:hypothetical protein D918_01916 [Trichuris suis]|nr:hypothetical protein D918_01916 [Trichuris suis]
MAMRYVRIYSSDKFSQKLCTVSSVVSNAALLFFAASASGPPPKSGHDDKRDRARKRSRSKPSSTTMTQAAPPFGPRPLKRWGTAHHLRVVAVVRFRIPLFRRRIQ